MKTKNLLLVLVAIIFLTACTKDDAPASNSQLLKKWYYVSLEYDGDTEIYDNTYTCDKDHLEFITDTRVAFKYITGCSSEGSEVNTQTVQFSFINNIYYDEGEPIFKIESISDTTLVLKMYIDEELNGEIAILTLTSNPENAPAGTVYDDLFKKWYWYSETIDGVVNILEHPECGKDFIEYKTDYTALQGLAVCNESADYSYHDFSFALNGHVLEYSNKKLEIISLGDDEMELGLIYPNYADTRTYILKKFDQ